MTGTFNNKNVQSGNEVTLNYKEAYLKGAAADNYTLVSEIKAVPSPVGIQETADGKISKRPVYPSGGIKALDKVYDGSREASVDCSNAVLSNVVEGEVLHIRGVKGVFLHKDKESYVYDENAEENKLVYLDYTDEVELYGETSSNYKLVFNPDKESAQNFQMYTHASITPRPVKIVWSASEGADESMPGSVIDYTYDGTKKQLVAAIGNLVTFGDKESGYYIDDCRLVVAGGEKNAGKSSYHARVTALTGEKSSNYCLPGTNTVKDFKINPKEVTVAWSNTNMVYNGRKQLPTASVKGLVGSDHCDVTVKADKESVDAGSYKATAGGLDNTNYTLKAGQTTDYTIRKKEITVEWSNLDMVYNGSRQLPTASVEGLVGSDHCDVTVQADRESVDAGSYKATAGGLDNTNYTLKAGQTADFTIRKKKVTIGWSIPDMVYNGRRQLPTAYVKGLVGGDGCQADVVTDKDPVNAGTYTAAVDKIGDDNYELEQDQKTAFTIRKADLKVEARDKTISYGDDPANDGVSYNGFILGENQDNLGGALSYQYNYKKNGKAGVYDIIPSGLTSDNYNIIYKAGKLTVSSKTTRLVGKASSKGKSKAKFSWNGVTDADRYVIYFAECSKPLKKIATLGSWRRSITKKKLKKGTTYKFKVVAQKKVRGRYKKIAESKAAHVIIGNKNKQYTNQKELKVPETTINLKPGQTYQIKASYKKFFKDKGLLTPHTPRLRYVSSNKNVATVSKKGRIKAVKTGTCSIFVQTINGKWKIITVNAAE